MLTTGQNVFLQIVDNPPRALCPSGAVEVTGTALTVRIKDSCAPDVDEILQAVEIGQETLIYYTLEHEFLNQPVRVDEVLSPEPDAIDACQDGGNAVLVSMKTLGAPVSAESRQCYRVSTVVAELTTSFDRYDDCELVDVSNTGFAVTSEEEFPVGAVITDTPRFEDLEPSGPVCIQSVRELKDGRFRYGLHCVELSFQKQMQKLRMPLQQSETAANRLYELDSFSGLRPN